MGSYLLPFAIGLFSIGLTTLRTMHVLHGEPFKTFVTNMLFSICYFYGTSYIVNRDVPGFIAFSLGAGMSTSYLAYRNLKKKESYNETRKRLAKQAESAIGNQESNSIN